MYECRSDGALGRTKENARNKYMESNGWNRVPEGEFKPDPASLGLIGLVSHAAQTPPAGIPREGKQKVDDSCVATRRKHPILVLYCGLNPSNRLKWFNWTAGE